MGANSSGSSIRPLVSSSTRLIRLRAMRKDDGTMPLAAPEWTPSVRTRTVRLPITMPRSEVVSHSCS